MCTIHPHTRTFVRARGKFLPLRPRLPASAKYERRRRRPLLLLLLSMSFRVTEATGELFFAYSCCCLLCLSFSMLRTLLFFFSSLSSSLCDAAVFCMHIRDFVRVCVSSYASLCVCVVRIISYSRRGLSTVGGGGTRRTIGLAPLSAGGRVWTGGTTSRGDSDCFWWWCGDDKWHIAII